MLIPSDTAIDTLFYSKSQNSNRWLKSANRTSTADLALGGGSNIGTLLDQNWHPIRPSTAVKQPTNNGGKGRADVDVLWIFNRADFKHVAADCTHTN